jgi:methyl-accepting chemotaxis protein
VEKMIQDLQNTICALEKLSNSSSTNSEQIDEWLDQLFQLKIDLVNASLSPTATHYKQATQAINLASKKSERAVANASVSGELIQAVSDAIAKLAKVLDHLVPLD